MIAPLGETNRYKTAALAELFFEPPEVLFTVEKEEKALHPQRKPKQRVFYFQIVVTHVDDDARQ